MPGTHGLGQSRPPTALKDKTPIHPILQIMGTGHREGELCTQDHIAGKSPHLSFSSPTRSELGRWRVMPLEPQQGAEGALGTWTHTGAYHHPHHSHIQNPAKAQHGSGCRGAGGTGNTQVGQSWVSDCTKPGRLATGPQTTEKVSPEGPREPRGLEGLICLSLQSGEKVVQEVAQGDVGLGGAGQRQPGGQGIPECP